MHPAKPQLVPKTNWVIRKTVAWLIVGPINPLSWAAIILVQDRIIVFGFIAAFTLWPCCLGATIGFLRLKQRRYSRIDLSEFVVGWTLLTTVIYTPLLICGAIAFFQISASGGIEFVHLQGLFFGLLYALLGFPFALMFGAVPAILAGLMSYWVIRYILFEKLTEQAATQSPSPVPSSVQ